jgi:hypothetical protein
MSILLGQAKVECLAGIGFIGMDADLPTWCVLGEMKNRYRGELLISKLSQQQFLLPRDALPSLILFISHMFD